MFDHFIHSVVSICLGSEAAERYNKALSKYGAADLIGKQIFFSVRKISLRILILDIHKMKTEGRLLGNTPKEQYIYYNNVCLNNADHIKSILTEFPEMHRLISLEIDNFCSMVNEITSSLEADKEQIARIFCDNRPFRGIQDLGLSAGDTHNGGKSAARIQLDNGVVLYYKPHSLQRNVEYQKVYGYLCQRAGIPCKKVNFLSHAAYGWEENIENKSCNTKEEIKRYYFRMGIHLFLGYVLSATDLHGENIVAHGEYPVIVDMETFPGYFIKTEESSADEKIETLLAASVIKTGMLPVLTWGKGKSTVVMSAMNPSGKIATPFRMPVVKNERTSEAYIDYEPLEYEMKESIVRLRDKAIDAGDYAGDLVRGFQSAYDSFLMDPMVEEMLSAFFHGRSRVILRHTQQYVMYQMASLHPDYMEREIQRRELLSVIHKEGESPLQEKIREYEISSLLQMDIPYFEMGGEENTLYDGDGKRYDGYFPCSPYEAWRAHMGQINREDMQRQSDMIRLSMALLNPGDRICRGEKSTAFFPPVSMQSRMKVQIKKIVTWICDRAVVSGEDINWIGLQFWDKERWSMMPLGMYLYSGISGILLLLAQYLQEFKDKKAEKIFRMALTRMIKYTEKLCEQKDDGEAVRTGLFDGEGSIVYTYLLLHRMTGEGRYTEYAEKHFRAMERFLPEDKCYDYLCGNAGALTAAVMLYRATKNGEYLACAIGMEQRLWEQRQETKRGAGWMIEGMPGPLAGRAHGNSGFLAAYAELYEASRDAQYLEKIKRLLDYEDSLYSEKLGNWIDLRKPGQEIHTMNAWCHGAPGILLSRLRLEELFQSESVNRDIQRAAEALFAGEPEGQVCLCHGLAGRLLIMQSYLRKYKNAEFQLRYCQDLEVFLTKMEAYDNLNAAEYLNPAFMNGISGVGWTLIKLYENNGTPR